MSKQRRFDVIMTLLLRLVPAKAYDSIYCTLTQNAKESSLLSYTQDQHGPFRPSNSLYIIITKKNIVEIQTPYTYHNSI